MAEKNYKREIAYKIKTIDLINGVFTRNDGFEPSFVSVSNKKVSRVDIIGVVTEKNGTERIVNFVVDDGFGTISVTFFDNLEYINSEFVVGDVVSIFGRVNDFNGIKINGEIIRKLNKKWMDVRKVEFEKELKNYVKDDVIENLEVNEKQTKIEEDLFSDEVDLSQKKEPIKSPYQQVWEIIKKNDDGNGVDFDIIRGLCKGMNEEKIEEICHSLLKEGEIYEIRAGYYKVLE